MHRLAIHSVSTLFALFGILPANAWAGLVIITGCAHPGVETIVRRAKEMRQKPVCLLMGGMHLMNHNSSRIDHILQTLRELQVEHVAPSHCTGDTALLRFEQVWGDRFLSGGLGARIDINEYGPQVQTSGLR